MEVEVLFLQSKKRTLFLLESTKTVLIGIFSASAMMLITAPGKPAPEPMSAKL